MVKLIPVKYGKSGYPCGISPKIQEVPGSFGKEKLDAWDGDISLHTEFSYGSRNFQKGPVRRYPCLCESQKDGIPQLWKSRQWAREFAHYVSDLCGDRIPKVIEIHPPFAEYTGLAGFLECYALFEEQITAVYKDVEIVVENRNGTQYKPRWFVLSRFDSFLELAELLNGSGLRLKIALDVPQLLSVHRVSPRTSRKIPEMLEGLIPIRDKLQSIHLWGKGPQGGAHCGDLNSYFRDHLDIKELLLNSLYDLLNDDVPRFFVPEVNSSQADLDSIVRDLLDHGFSFI